MPPGAVHVDIPSFRGADRDRYPMQLLQAMGSSGLFEPWRVVEAGAVFWLYDRDGQIRISILWKARVSSDRLGRAGPTRLSPERIVEIFCADLASREVQTPVVSTSALFDRAWLDLVHSSYYHVVPLDVASGELA